MNALSLPDEVFTLFQNRNIINIPELYIDSMGRLRGFASSSAGPQTYGWCYLHTIEAWWPLTTIVVALLKELAHMLCSCANLYSLFANYVKSIHWPPFGELFKHLVKELVLNPICTNDFKVVYFGWMFNRCRFNIVSLFLVL